MKIVFSPQAWQDYIFWKNESHKTLKRINTLIMDTVRNGNEGIGRPEPLRYEYSGYWSRRIDSQNRLVYQLLDDELRIISCRYHYGK